MPRITPQEAGRRGGLIGGKSRSAAKLAAAKKNGFQRTPAPESEQAQPAQQETTPGRLPLLLTVPKEGTD